MPSWYYLCRDAGIAPSIDDCYACPAGKFNDEEGLAECKTTCGLGKYYDASRQACTACEPGRFSNVGGVEGDMSRITTNCSECPLGRIASHAGMTQCERQCNLGQFRLPTIAKLSQLREFCYARNHSQQVCSSESNVFWTKSLCVWFAKARHMYQANVSTVIPLVGT